MRPDSKTAVSTLSAPSVTTAGAPSELLTTLASMVVGIDDLATELISDIFVDAVKPEQWPGAFTKRTLWALPFVCHRWRDIAYDTPKLWRCIHVNLDLVTDAASEERCIAHIDTFLARAKGSVALNVRIVRVPNIFQASIWRAARDIIGSVCRSCTIHVEVFDVSTSCAPEIAACLEQSTPRLEVLSVHYRVDPPRRAIWTLPRAQNLCKVVWVTDDAYFQWPGTETFPLVCEIDISIMGLGQVEIAQIFTRCPNLAALNLDVDHPFASPTQMESLSLRSVRLQGDLASSISELWLPNLEKAEIANIAEDDLVTLFSGPLASASSLTVGHGIAMNSELARALVHCPQLQHLCLYVDGLYVDGEEKIQEFFEDMSQPLNGTTTWICPRLRSVHIRDLWLSPAGDLFQKIMVFATNRTRPSPDNDAFVGPIQRLEHLYFEPPLSRHTSILLVYGSVNTALNALGLSTASIRVDTFSIA
ncbi:hypothetical protein EXIGLDRAFT_843154 [Exidia glandulosa HHB12029]|uniref:Uncharacterized protein n=1 Tax=Exidia glandulosa HHB12029 TaxID=1314781 RepID=A0A165CVA3_EXIGL|nr:hypothetical protein EXIGLDRAFT_843154 [Exidia glandulosa HHB12029]